MYNYNPFQWLLIFYIYCILGWLVESAVVSIQQRRLVNRGFLRGPMLPIYGFGATIMLHVSLPLLGHPVAIYFAGLVTATAFEYLVGVLMETLFKVRYWDYSAHRFQFQGRICLDSSIAWGFLSLLLAYVLHKPVAQLITGLPRTLSIPFAAVVTVLFLYDVTLSAKAAFEFAAVLEELEKLRAEAEGLRVQLNLGVREAQDRLDEARAQLRAAHSELESGLRGRIQSAASSFASASPPPKPGLTSTSASAAAITRRSSTRTPARAARNSPTCCTFCTTTATSPETQSAAPAKP